MPKFAVMLATAGMLLATPALASTSTSTSNPNSGQPLAGVQMAQVSVQVGGRPGVRRYNSVRRYGSSRCSTKIIYRGGRKTVVKRCY